MSGREKRLMPLAETQRSPRKAEAFTAENAEHAERGKIE